MLPIVTTKLFTPTSHKKIIDRDRLLMQLNHGASGKLTLVSAAAGFGKTVLVSEWVRELAEQNLAITWLSLDEKDGDSSRFLTYLIAALRKISPAIGKIALGMLQAPQTPPIEALFTTIVNDLTAVQNRFVLVLDDYHAIDNPQIDRGLLFLLENMPPQMHVVITTREDPDLPLPRLRVQGELTEIRARDLRFTPIESADFLNKAMGLQLEATEIEALETRTEGWAAGLQLAALSLSRQDQQNRSTFIESFTGSHRFVLDYLLEEVLARQPEHIRQFLLNTAILDRLSPSLCEALMADSQLSGHDMLIQLEQGNLFIVPLDHERNWYRYHHLFGDLLRQQLQQELAGQEGALAQLHLTASDWYETNGYEIEAFQHATAAQDIERAKRLIEGNRMPLQFRGGVLPILKWIRSLPTAVRDEHPLLWVIYGSCLLMIGQIVGVEEAAQAAENKLDLQAQDEETRDLIGRIASMRATIAVTQHQPSEIITQATKALEYLHPQNDMVRSALTWMLGYVYQLSGNRTAAHEAYAEAIHACRRVGHKVIEMMATMGLAEMQLSQNQLNLARETYQAALDVLDDPPPPASEAHFGLARIYYEWNKLEESRTHQQKAVELASLIENTDRAVAGRVLGAKISLAEKEFDEANKQLNRAEQVAKENKYTDQLAEIRSLNIRIALQRNDIDTAVKLTESQSRPVDISRISVAQEQYEEAIEILNEQYQAAVTQQWANQELQTCLLLALAYASHGKQTEAMRWLTQTLRQAEQSQFTRLFLDEGRNMHTLLRLVDSNHPQKPYANSILSAENLIEPPLEDAELLDQQLVDPLTPRELEILKLVAEGYSNQEICKQLFLALSTVKGHNRNIYGKLQVQRRTEAVARARALGLL